MATGNSILDFIEQTAKEDPIAAGEMMVQSLMAGDPATLKMGYSLGSALISAAEYLNLTVRQVAVIADRIYEAKD